MKKGATAGVGGSPLQTKSSGVTTPKPRNPAARPHSPDDEPDIDVENAPVTTYCFF